MLPLRVAASNLLLLRCDFIQVFGNPKERLSFKVQLGDFGEYEITQVGSTTQHHTNVIPIHEEDRFLWILLQETGHVIGPAVDREEESHGLFPGFVDLAFESVEFSNVREFPTPPALYEVMPPFHFEGTVNLLTASLRVNERTTEI